MFPPRFRYEAPRSIAEAISLLHEGDGEAKVLAGGQSLVPLLKLRFASPELLVDINNLPDLAYHRVGDDGALHIGALCRHADLEHSDLLAARQPTMIAAAPLIADPIVRTRGTLVGSLCHADPQGDWAAVITALGGQVVAQGPGGRRTIAIGDFVTGPFQNTLAYDEVAVEAIVPAAQGRLEGGFLSSRGASVTSPRQAPPWPSSSTATASCMPASRSAGSAAGPSTLVRPQTRWPVRCSARPRSRGPPTSPPRLPSRAPTTAAAPTTSGTSSTPS